MKKFLSRILCRLFHEHKIKWHSTSIREGHWMECIDCGREFEK